MQRKDQLIKILLTGLAEKDRSRSQLTAMIKNYEKAAREEAIVEMMTRGLVKFSPGERGVGRRPFIGSITDDGMARLKELETLVKDSSVWSI